MGFTIAGVTAATIGSVAASATSAVVGAVGAIQSGQAKSQAADYQAQVAKNNAITAGQNATLATQQADAKAQSDNRATAIRLGAQRAAFGANGVTLDSGSVADVQANTSAAGALGASQDIYQGDLSAYSLRNQAANFTGQAALDTATADNASTAGDLGAGTSILSGASSFASKWPTYGFGGTAANNNTGYQSAAGAEP